MEIQNNSFHGNERPEMFTHAEAFVSPDEQTIILDSTTRWASLLGHSKNNPYWVSTDGGDSFYQLLRPERSEYDRRSGTLLQVPGTRRHLLIDGQERTRVDLPDGEFQYRDQSMIVKSFRGARGFLAGSDTYTALPLDEAISLAEGAEFFMVPDSYRPVSLDEFIDEDGVTRQILVSEMTDDSTVLENQYRIHVGVDGEFVDVPILYNPHHQHRIYEMAFEYEGEGYLMVYPERSFVDYYLRPYWDTEESYLDVLREAQSAGEELSEHRQSAIALMDFLADHTDGASIIRMPRNEEGIYQWPETLEEAQSLVEQDLSRSSRTVERRLGVPMASEPVEAYQDLSRDL